MKFPRSMPHFRSLKFAPFALISLFLFSNLTGLLFSHVLAPVASASPDAFYIPADIPSSGNQDLDKIIFQVSQDQGVDPRFIHAVIWQESKYDVHARSHAGAQGLMQLMPATARQYGVSNPYNPVENVRAGVAYLRELLDRYAENEELALAAYNAGPAAVDRHGQNVPPYRETRQYVAQINQMAGRPIELRSARIYKVTEVVDGHSVVRYTDRKPTTGSYEVVGR